MPELPGFLFGAKPRNERRNAVRRKTHNLVIVSIPHERKMLNLVDISECGAQFLSVEPLERNRRLNLKINLAEHNCHICVTGLVVWSKTMAGNGCLYRVGVSFLEVGQEAWATLRQYLTPAQAA